MTKSHEQSLLISRSLHPSLSNCKTRPTFVSGESDARFRDLKKADQKRQNHPTRKRLSELLLTKIKTSRVSERLLEFFCQKKEVRLSEERDNNLNELEFH